MPLLLRRSAPSPSVDELSFATRCAVTVTATATSTAPSASMRATMRATTVLGESSASASSSSRSSSSQHCPTHSDVRSSTRRRSTNSTETESSEERDSHDAERDAKDATDAMPCTCRSSSRRTSHGSTKRVSEKMKCADGSVVDRRSSKGQALELADLEASAHDGGVEMDMDDMESCCCSLTRDSTCHKCERGSESTASETSLAVMIRDSHLAVVDVELKNLRSTFAKSVYSRFSNMSRRLRRNSAPKRITAT